MNAFTMPGKKISRAVCRIFSNPFITEDMNIPGSGKWYDAIHTPDDCGGI